MDARTKQARIETFERMCRARGIPCTIQRRTILGVTLDREDHPTANQVFEAVSKRNRGISRATVHRTLETLVQMGVIAKTCHPGNVVRYDACTETHHHLVCMHCSKVIDFRDENLDSLQIPDTSAYGFEVADLRVQLRGVCSDCRERMSRERDEKRK